METEDIDRIYNIEMMKTKTVGNYEVTRVPNGWLFRHIENHFDRRGNLTNGTECMAFVPFIKKSKL